MTLTRIDPADSVRTRRAKSATGGTSPRPYGVRPLRSPTRPPAGPPALSPPAAAPQPAAAIATSAGASRAAAFVSFMSPPLQRDLEPEDGPVRCEGEHLAARAEDGRHEQAVLRARPFRDQPVRPVVDERGPRRLGAAARPIGVARGIDRRLAHVPGR